MGKEKTRHIAIDLKDPYNTCLYRLLAASRKKRKEVIQSAVDIVWQYTQNTAKGYELVIAPITSISEVQSVNQTHLDFLLSTHGPIDEAIKKPGPERHTIDFPIDVIARWTPLIQQRESTSQLVRDALIHMYDMVKCRHSGFYLFYKPKKELSSEDKALHLSFYHTTISMD